MFYLLKGDDKLSVSLRSFDPKAGPIMTTASSPQGVVDGGKDPIMALFQLSSILFGDIYGT